MLIDHLFLTNLEIKKRMVLKMTLSFLGAPLGYVVYYIYKLTNNYAVSIIIFTIILRIVLIPMAIKQQKSLARTSAFQPYINEINKKYAKNIVKKNEELQKFYKIHNINPAAGCLPMFLPLIVLFGMLDVVYRPLTHISRLAPEIVEKAINILKETNSEINVSNSSIQLNLISDVINSPSNYESLGSDVVSSIQNIDLNFLGFNIGEIAKINSITVLFPILALIFSFLQVLISYKTNSMPSTNSGSPSFKFIMFTMPLFSIWISLTVPIGVSLYWIVGYILQIVQILILNKICNMNELREKVVLEIEEIRKKSKKKKKKIDVEKGEEEILTEKDRLNNARKILAEKYDE